LTIPKGLTFNTLVKLAGSHKVGNAAKFRYIWNRISNEIGNIPVDKTYRIVITNNVFVFSMIKKNMMCRIAFGGRTLYIFSACFISEHFIEQHAFKLSICILRACANAHISDSLPFHNFSKLKGNTLLSSHKFVNKSKIQPKLDSEVDTFG